MINAHVKADECPLDHSHINQRSQFHFVCDAVESFHRWRVDDFRVPNYGNSVRDDFSCVCVGICCIPISRWSFRRCCWIAQSDHSYCCVVGSADHSERNYSGTSDRVSYNSSGDFYCVAFSKWRFTCSDFSNYWWNYCQLVSGFRMGTSKRIDQHSINPGCSSRSSIDGVADANCRMAWFIFSNSTAGIFNRRGLVVVCARLSGTTSRCKFCGAGVDPRK